MQLIFDIPFLTISTKPDLYLHPTILPSYFPPTKKSAHRHYGDERCFVFLNHSEHLPALFLLPFLHSIQLLLLSPGRLYFCLLTEQVET